MTLPTAPVAAHRGVSELPDDGKRPSGASPRGWRIALFAAGLAVLAAGLALVGWKPIAENLARIGHYFVLLVALYGAAQVAFTLGWWVIAGRRGPASFRDLFAAYLAGDSINYFTSVGGEPVKAHLLRARMGFGPAFATIWVNRNADVLAQWLFLVAGAAVALTRYSLPPLPRFLVIAGLTVLGALAIGFTGMQRRGFFGPILRLLKKVPVLAKRLSGLEAHAEEVDARIRVYYRREEHGAQFAIAVAWGFLGWCGGLVETWIVLRLLSPSHTFASAFAVESLAMILNGILLFIPARIGSAEAIRLGVAALVGLTPAQGAAYALVRRARELLWLAPGGVVLLKHHLIDVAHLRLERLEPSGREARP
jgi:uncharacterized protein (TIRG00374 family)